MNKTTLSTAIALAIVASSGCGVDPEVYPLTSIPMADLDGLYQRCDDHERVVFAVLGDPGTADDNQEQVGEALHQVCAERGCDFAIVTGDNIYPAGIKSVYDDDLEEAFEEPYEALGNFDFWLVLGNHDWAGKAQAQIDYTLHSSRWRMPGPAYVVPALPPWLNLVGFDSQTVHTDSKLAEPQRAFLEEALCGREGWHLLFGHHPVTSGGPHGGDANTAAYLNDIDAACDIDLYFSGHDHHQAFMDAGGFFQVQQGASGKTTQVDRLAGTRFAAEKLGFTIVEATSTTLDITYYDKLTRPIFRTTLPEVEAAPAPRAPRRGLSDRIETPTGNCKIK